MRSRDRSRCGPLFPDRGFTLIEMLVVLVIAAVAMSAIPTILAGLPGARLRAAADQMAGILRELHSEAIGSRTTMEFVLDPAVRVYRITGDANARKLPDIVAEVDVKTEAALPAEGPPTIRFFADGSATGGTIRFHRNAQSAAITVDWLTGRVRRDE